MSDRFHKPSPLAAALSLSFTVLTAQASPSGDAPSSADGLQARDLDTIEVHGERLNRPSSVKYTEPLRDIPQTITVVTRESIDQQGLLGLKDVLGTLPGITFGAGEGGGGYGDSINLRGYSANGDITVDGVRDTAQYTRSDAFNLEAIELVNGANSVFSGAGSVGGNINLVSKVAREGDFHAATLGAGTDEYARLTVDSNFDLENGTALRLNAMGHLQDVPGRDEEFRHRWGFAPSVAFGLGTDTRFTLSYLHQHDNNLPQYGVPYALNPFNDGPLPGVDPSTYFGYRNTSRQEIDVDVLTGVLETDLGERVSLRSLARLQRVEQYLSVTALQGSWCRFDGTNPYTGQPCAGQPAGSWNPNGGPRGNVRDTENRLAYSQTDLTARFLTGGVEHHLVAGLSLSWEDYELLAGNIFRNPDGSQAGITYPIQDLADPYNVWTGPVNFIPGATTEGSLETQAVYVFDTLRFNPRWLLNLGARIERTDGDTVIHPAPGTTGPVERFENSDTLFSFRAGLVYKPVETASLYLSVANSRTPSKSAVNGACNASNCNVDPEKARIFELGGKWDVLGERLALTAALFRNERTNYRVANADPAMPEQVLDGRSRVDGLALGMAGRINRQWSIFANYTLLDSEVLQNAADGAADPVRGRELTQTPRHAANLWTAYALQDWTFGYGFGYQGSFYPQNNSAEAYRKTDGYWVHRAMVGYQVNERLGLQLNINNLFDEEYYTSIRNNLTVDADGTVTGGNGWAIPGDGRSAVLTATFRF